MSYVRSSLLSFFLLPILLVAQAPSISSNSAESSSPIAASRTNPDDSLAAQEQSGSQDSRPGIPEVVPVQPQGDEGAQKKAKHKKVAAESEESANADATDKSSKDNDSPVNPASLHNPVLWHDPGKISFLDLYYGQGGEKGLPVAPFTFESEDHNGTNPKFDVRDAKGEKWRVKLGTEARPEVVASRLLWAMGYFVNDDYVLESAKVENLHIQRGAGMAKHGHIEDARFARKPSGQKKIGIWKWKENPFSGTREFNGLRVMMAVMNNWDLKDVNNAVFEDRKQGRDIFLTSDIGATFGTNGLSWTVSRSKGNIGTFKDSKFIEHASDTEVDFGTPKPPTAMLFETAGLEAKQYAMRKGLEWIGKSIPREDARWIGSMLRQLSHQQIVDAFRAGQFPSDQIDAYVDIVESRIQELATL
jgi:hypothetical protein